MPDPDPNEFVHIKHPKIDAIGGPVTREAFESNYKDKGWSIAKPDDVPADAPPLPVSAAPTTTTTTTTKGA